MRKIANSNTSLPRSRVLDPAEIEVRLREIRPGNRHHLIHDPGRRLEGRHHVAELLRRLVVGAQRLMNLSQHALRREHERMMETVRGLPALDRLRRPSEGVSGSTEVEQDLCELKETAGEQRTVLPSPSSARIQATSL
jgi:hypothetical protein